LSVPIDKLAGKLGRGSTISELEEAIEKLAASRDPKAVEPLIGALEDDHVRHRAADALVALGDLAVVPLLKALEKGGRTLEGAVKVLGRLRAAPAERPLLQLLENAVTNREPAVAIAEALGQLESKAAIQPLIRLLGQAHWRSDNEWRTVENVLVRLGGRPTIELLVEALDEDDPKTRLASVKALGQLRARASTGQIARLLHDDEPVVRLEALRVLMKTDANELTDEDVVGPLSTMLTDRNLVFWNSRTEVANALLRWGDAKALDSLILGLSDAGSRELRPLDNTTHEAYDTIMRAIERLSGRSLVETLARKARAQDTDVSVRAVAIRVLGVFQESEYISLYIQMLQNDEPALRAASATALGQMGGADGVQALIDVLEDSETSVRLAAIAALGELQDERSIEPLIQALSDIRCTRAALISLAPMICSGILHGPKQPISDSCYAAAIVAGHAAIALLVELTDYGDFPPTEEELAVRHLAVALLMKIEGDSLEYLSNLFCGKGPAQNRNYLRSEQREALVHIFASINDARSVDVMTRAIRSDDVRVRLQAVSSLAKMGEAAFDLLVEAVADPDPNVRARSAESLGELREARVVKPLLKLLDDEVHQVRNAAQAALKSLGTMKVQQLTQYAFEVERPETRLAVVELLGGIGTSKVTKLLTQMLDDRSGRVRLAAIRGLQWSKETAESLIPLLDDSDRDVRLAAVDVLGGLVYEPAIEGLMNLLKDYSDQVRERAITTLGKIGDPTCIPSLIAKLNDQEQSVVAAACNALARLEATEAIPHLVQLLHDPDSRGGKAAARALEHMPVWEGLSQSVAHPSGQNWCRYSHLKAAYGQVPASTRLRESCEYIGGWLQNQPSTKEESITDWFLYELSTRIKGLIYRAFTRMEEAKSTGADWEWWFLFPQSYTKIRVQAKKLDPTKNNYAPIAYKNRQGLQIEMLIRDAIKHNFVPLYVFYTPAGPPTSCGRDHTKDGVYAMGARTLWEGFIEGDARSVWQADVLRKAVPLSCLLSCPLVQLSDRRLIDFLQIHFPKEFTSRPPTGELLGHYLRIPEYIEAFIEVVSSPEPGIERWQLQYASYVEQVDALAVFDGRTEE
jgi:HEAT repeat protein